MAKYLELRKEVWYFRKRINGKLTYRKLSKSLDTAKDLRDQYLLEIKKHGDFLDKIQTPTEFGEITVAWSKRQQIRIRQGQIKNSTYRDWRSAVNLHVLPFFGNMQIESVNIPAVERFIDTLECGPKRVNNILVPVRSIFKYAKRHGYVVKNPMDDIDNLKVEPADIYPLDIEEVQAVITATPVHYQPFIIMAFFTGLRFGELAALKWNHVNLKRKLILVRETLVYGEEGRTKTTKSKRDVDMLIPVYDALNFLKKGKYVFRDREGALMTPDHFREVIWKPALVKAEVHYRPPIQTRHTFATLMIDAGEDLGWVQRMMGHGSLQMIFTRYYSWVKKTTRNDGSAFEQNVLPKYNQIKKDSQQNAVSP